MDPAQLKGYGDLIQNLGMATIVALYFMVRDWRLMSGLAGSMKDIAVNLALLNKALHVEADNHG